MLSANTVRAVEPPPLIPREVLFGNPDRANVQVSPDGRHLSYCAPHEGVLNVWVAPINDLAEARVVTRDRKRGIREYYWAWTGDRVVYRQDEGGDENYNVFVADLATGETKNLTRNPKVQAQILALSRHHPDEMLVALNDRSAEFHDVHRVNLRTGTDVLVLRNPEKIEGQNVTGFVVDEQFNVRFAVTITDSAGSTLWAPAKDGGWTIAESIPMEDDAMTNVIGFDETGRILYLRDSRGRDTAAIFRLDTTTAQRTLLADDPRADADDPLRHPRTRRVQAVPFVHERLRWQVVDPELQADFDYLATVSPGDDLNITSRSQDDLKWTVHFQADNGPAKHYLYDRTQRRAEFLFTGNRQLEGLPLAKMRPLVIKSRDGLDLVSYLTLPPQSDADGDGIPDAPVPMVLIVHGGPWGRDRWGFNATHQWLANRGYAVLSVNFRGSTGFGKAFTNAANHEWGGRMHDDLIDAVNWAIDARIARKDRVAIQGGSYGGYSALAGITLTPEVFACSVSIVGVSRIVTLMETVPPYWKPAMTFFKARVGDHTTEQGRRFLDGRSPLTHVDRIKRPLLIGHGANDARVKKAESDQIVRAMREKNLPVTYVLYPDEGHGFYRPENRMSFFAVAEAFLAGHLGGRFEPIGDDFNGSTIQVEVGADEVPGLKEHLNAAP
ncbi:MAG TPA: S9 family peptidase [Tepidisphaeraceae bacterium]|nr:S9 family peptidase [Tepidisphaeraceae bacterium]